MSEITANFIVEQTTAGFVVDQNEITFTPQGINLNIGIGTNQLGANAAGPNTAIQFNDNGVFGGSNAFTFNKTSNTVIIGAGGGGNLSNANVIQANTFLGVVGTAAQPNITSLGTLTAFNYSNTSAVNGLNVVGGSNIGAHVSTFTNNLGSDRGVQMTVYGNGYTAGSYFQVGANGIAVTGNTSSQMAFGTVSGNSTIIGANNQPVLKAHANGQAEIMAPHVGAAVALVVNGGTQDIGIQAKGVNPYLYLTPGSAGHNWALQSVNSTVGFRVFDSTRSAQTIAVDNSGAVSIQTPAAGNALTVLGNVVANGLASPTAASAATDTTISHKFPIVLNGVTYYIALTTNP